jgi:hypothetical protein
LTHEEHIVVEATGNAQAVAEAVATFVGRIASGSSSARKPGACRGGAVSNPRISVTTVSASSPRRSYTILAGIFRMLVALQEPDKRPEDQNLLLDDGREIRLLTERRKSRERLHIRLDQKSVGMPLGALNGDNSAPFREVRS